VEDVPVTAVDILRTLVAQKLKKGLADVPLTKAIKDLVGGKDTVCIGYVQSLTVNRQVHITE
jgi:fatty acid synthase subunit alpha